MITRRRFLQWFAPLGVVGSLAATYAVIVEPLYLRRVTRYDVTPPRWPTGLNLTIAVVADVHACKPWMDIDRIESIVEQTNALGADLIVLVGDYVVAHRFITGHVRAEDWARALAGLKAPLGVHAILGNHDWWHDDEAQRTGHGPTLARRVLEAAGISVYENDVVRLSKAGQNFWLAGLGDQLAFVPSFRHVPGRRRGIDDLPGTLSKVPEADPVVLLAHEPDIMVRVPERVSLVLSGHTHGGQVRLFGWSPIVPSRYGNRFAYGHVREQCDLIVSGGLGCSIMPVRFGMPPEIVHVTVSGGSA
ncbi:MAG: metallophosphoesterase [Xanthobacteraceae bacterium]